MPDRTNLYKKLLNLFCYSYLVQQTLLKNANNYLINLGGSNRSGEQIIDVGVFSDIVNHLVIDKKIEFKFYFTKSTVEFSLKEDEELNVYIEDFAFSAENLNYSLKNLSTVDYDKKDFNLNNVDKLDIKLDNFVGKDSDLIKLKTMPRILRDGFFFQIVSVKPDENSFNSYINDKFLNRIKENNFEIDEIRSFYAMINSLMNYFSQISISSAEHLQEIKKNFSNIKYIGPIRQTAERYYSAGSYNDLGYKGEHAIQILAQDNNLKTKVEKYFSRMGIAEALQVYQKTNQKVFEFKVKTQCSERGVNFKDVGCGISQILPIIVQSLMINDESLIVLEQPEVHLHPRTQAELADFFVENASINNRFLIETHSDYLIERIRYHVAKGDLKSNDVLIYYIEPDPATKSSRPIEVEINSMGQYRNLPKGYITNFRLKETKNMTNILLKNLSEKEERL